MKEKIRSNDEVYNDWLEYIKKRNSYYKQKTKA